MWGLLSSYIEEKTKVTHTFQYLLTSFHLHLLGTDVFKLHVAYNRSFFIAKSDGSDDVFSFSPTLQHVAQSVAAALLQSPFIFILS